MSIWYQERKCLHQVNSTLKENILNSNISKSFSISLVATTFLSFPFKGKIVNWTYSDSYRMFYMIQDWHSCINLMCMKQPLLCARQKLPCVWPQRLIGSPWNSNIYSALDCQGKLRGRLAKWHFLGRRTSRAGLGGMRAQSSLWLSKEFGLLLKAVRFDLFYCIKIYITCTLPL